MSKSDDNSSFMEIKKTMLPMPMKLSEQNNKSLGLASETTKSNFMQGPIIDYNDIDKTIGETKVEDQRNYIRSLMRSRGRNRPQTHSLGLYEDENDLSIAS